MQQPKQAMKTTQMENPTFRHKLSDFKPGSLGRRPRCNTLQCLLLIHTRRPYLQMGTNIDRLVAGGKFSSSAQLNEQSKLMFHFLPKFKRTRLFSRYKINLLFNTILKLYFLKVNTLTSTSMYTYSIQYKIHFVIAVKLLGLLQQPP